MALANLTELEQAWDEWMTDKGANGKATQSANWRKSNPGEWAKLKAYREGGARPQLGSVTGKQMVFETDAWLKAKGTTEPAPAVVYPSVSRYPSEAI